MTRANLDKGLSGYRWGGWVLQKTRLKDVTRIIGLGARRLFSAKHSRKHSESQWAFREFARKQGSSLVGQLNSDVACRHALLVGSDSERFAPWELGLVKALQKGGFRVTVLARRANWVRWYFALAGVQRIVFWDSFTAPVPAGRIRRMVEDFKSPQDLFDLHYRGVRVGKSAASTTLRHTRAGTLDFNNADHRHAVANSLATGLKYVMASERILDEVNPDLVIFSDRGYNRNGMMFDLAIAQERDTVTWNAAHRSNTIILKRFTPETRDVHPCSISADSWGQLKQAPWTTAQADRVIQELHQNYESGEWYSEVGTQFNKQILKPESVQNELGLDPTKKTAVIFPHILWDGTFFWGTDLFPSYEAWLEETLKAAAANPRVNWIVKIHPANTMKDVREGRQGEPAEVATARAVLPDWPDHIKFLPADSPINTFSLFQAMDFCLTVRGTIGIEAAAFGIPVITAGTGRFDRLGFTVDPDSAESYLKLVTDLPDLELLSAGQKELALRFAHGVFLDRPLEMESFQFHFQRDETATVKISITVDNAKQLKNARDIRQLADWFADRSRLDFLNCRATTPPASQTPPSVHGGPETFPAQPRP
jgi:hypothetical protein